MKKPIIIITGPTAVGKTSLSIGLAKRIGGEIISADSMQVYRHMDIGSAKATKEEMDGIPHHLIDILEPSCDFNVVMFQKKAREALEDIYSRGSLPIIAGGTGFYIQALLYDIDFTETEEDNAFRCGMERLAREKVPAFSMPCLNRRIRNQLPRFIRIILKGSSEHWNTIIRQERRYRIITSLNGRRNHPISFSIMS